MAVDPISAGLGVVSMLGGKSARKSADKAAGRAASLNKFLEGIARELYARGKAYDPSADTAASADYAKKQTADTLQKALGNLNAEFRAAGGSPTGDTEFRVRAQGLTNRVTDPLRAFLAEQKANEFWKKNQALMAAFGAPNGQILQTYSNMANNSNGNAGMMGGLGLLSNGLSGLFKGIGGGGAPDPWKNVMPDNNNYGGYN